MEEIHPSHLFPVVERPALDNKEGWRNKDILKEIKTSTVKERETKTKTPVRNRDNDKKVAAPDVVARSVKVVSEKSDWLNFL